jgi:hypothetical protein
MSADTIRKFDDRLTPFARVALDAASSIGQPPRFHKGMTLEDAVIITGLPRDEAARRIREMRNDSDPDRYAALHLAESSGSEYTPAPVAPEPPPPAKILQFPLPFGEDTRAVSNSLARGSLFAAVKDRQHFKDYMLVYEEDGMKIEFKGEQLNQDDHDTLLQLVTMALHEPFGADIVRAVNAVLSGMGRTTHQEQRRQLFEQISRLVCGTVRLTTSHFRYEGHLIDDATTPQDQATLPQYHRHLAYRLNPKFARFYAEAAYTLFDSKERGKLKGRGSELAKWLHLWIIGNAKQYPHKVETIRQLCGSMDKILRSFRQNLRAALNLLKEAGIITAWHIDPKSDLVTIERMPSPSQTRYINKKVSRKPHAAP